VASAQQVAGWRLHGLLEAAGGWAGGRLAVATAQRLQPRGYSPSGRSPAAAAPHLNSWKLRSMVSRCSTEARCVRHTSDSSVDACSGARSRARACAQRGPGWQPGGHYRCASRDERLARRAARHKHPPHLLVSVG
jgi:hypothetical protein